MASFGALFSTLRRNASMGCAEKRTHSADSILNVRSGMAGSLSAHLGGAIFHLFEKRMNLPPDFRAAGQPFPVSAHQPRQPVAFVDGKDEIFPRGTVHQQSFGSGMQPGEQRFSR